MSAHQLPLRVLLEVNSLLMEIRHTKPSEPLSAGLWHRVAMASGALGYHVEKIAGTVSVEVKEVA